MLVDFEKLIASAEQAQAKIADLEPCLQAPELRPAVAPPLATPPPAWLRCEVQELQELLRELLQCTRGIITEGDDKKQDEHQGSVTKALPLTQTAAPCVYDLAMDDEVYDGFYQFTGENPVKAKRSGARRRRRRTRGRSPRPPE